MSRRRQNRSPSYRRRRRSSRSDSFSPARDRRRDDYDRMSSRRRARSLSPGPSRGYESTREMYRSRRRPRRRGYSSSDGIHSDNAELGSVGNRDRDLDFDRGGGRRGDRSRGRRGGRRQKSTEETMKELIEDFFEDYSYIREMVMDETKQILKLPCMEGYKKKYYDGVHRPLTSYDVDKHSKPLEMLKDLESELVSMNDNFNKKFRSKFFNEDWADDELDVTKTRYSRSSRRSPRRRRGSGRRDSYDRRSRRDRRVY